MNATFKHLTGEVTLNIAAWDHDVLGQHEACATLRQASRSSHLLVHVPRSVLKADRFRALTCVKRCVGGRIYRQVQMDTLVSRLTISVLVAIQLGTSLILVQK